MDTNKIWPNPSEVPTVVDCKVTPVGRPPGPSLDAVAPNTEMPGERAPQTAGALDTRESLTQTTQDTPTDADDDLVDINTPRARLHVLTEGLALVIPGIFRDFSPELWDRAQKRFQKLKIHKKTPDGTNIWTCQVAKDRKHSIIRVMLIPDAETVLGKLLLDTNPVLKLLG